MRKTVLAGAVALALTLSLAACTSSGGDSTQPTTGPAHRGGTLKVLGNGEFDYLDPALSSFVPSQNLMRAVTRQLANYESVPDEQARITPKPDLATALTPPTNGGKTYTYTIRDGVYWDVPSGKRPIVAADIARGFKRLCNPIQPSGKLAYYLELIQGMRTFCDGLKSAGTSVAAVKSYIEGHDISGIQVSGDKKITFQLTEPASDFVYILTLPSSSPVPVEFLDYKPDSPEFRQKFISDGPYKIKSYTADKSLILERNPAWSRTSDSLRQANVDEIDLTFGVDASAIVQQIQVGSGDMMFDTDLTPAEIQQLKAAGDKKMMTVATGDVNPDLWINTMSDNNGGALKKLKVREALEYAVDKAAVVQSLGGKDVAEVSNGVFGDGVQGYQPFDPYPTPGSKGDPAKAKQLLAEAGYPNGLSLKMPFRNKDVEPQLAQTIQASLEKAGFKITLIPVPATDFYSTYLVNKDNTKAGQWDIAATGWTPDWMGGAARSVFVPQFTCDGGSYNYAGYCNKNVDALAKQAMTSTDPSKVGSMWHQVDVAIMKDAPVVPIATRKKILYHSARVQNFVPYALAVDGDWTDVSLSQ